MRKKKLYHIYLFLFGVLYYFISPIIILMSGVVDGFPGVSNLYKYDISRLLPLYLIIVAIFVVSYIFGCLLPLHYLKHLKRKRKDYVSFTAKDIILVAAPFILSGELIVFNARAVLFKGYSIDYNAELLGSLATCNCVFLLFYLWLKQLPKSIIRTLMLFLIIEFSIVLLGLGSRMYVLIPIFAISMQYVSTHKVNIKKLILTASLIVLLLLTVGILRLSSMDISANMMLYIGCAEPLFTWITAISYLDYNEIALFSLPTNFVTSFVNLIPTILFSSKSDYVMAISGNYDAPFGATSLMASILDNFGLFGGAVFLFAVGFVLTLIRYNWDSRFGRAYYYCACSIIPFQLFRDGFGIVNKMLFFNFLILPLILWVFVHLVKMTQTKDIVQSP